MVVVPGSLAQVGVLAAPCPGLTVVARGEDRTVLGFDNGVETSWPGGGSGDADLADDVPLRETGVVSDLFPGIAAVVAAVQAAILAAAGEVVWTSVGFPGNDVENPRIVRVHRDVVRAGLVTDVEYLFPGFPAVG